MSIQIIMPGSYANKNGTRVPILMQNDQNSPVGMATVTRNDYVDDDGRVNTLLTGEVVSMLAEVIPLMPRYFYYTPIFYTLQSGGVMLTELYILLEDKDLEREKTTEDENPVAIALQNIENGDQASLGVARMDAKETQKRIENTPGFE